MTTSRRPGVERARVRARGVVQGVGFRPFVHALATRHGLVGWVRNDDAGALIEVEGEREAVAALVEALRREPPPLARVDSLDVEPLVATSNDSRFSIVASACDASVSTSLPPDVAPCRACLAELFDPAARHYGHPFTSCTQCGPRFSIATALPWDRARTSMARFALCERCAAEFGDPGDRRFHAEATACPACGPALSTSIDEIVARLRAGRVVAIKGIGGFHLACDATDAAAVARLRRAKERAGKPFAVMVAGVASARRFVELDSGERASLEAPHRPIVLARRREVEQLAPPLADELAPGLAWLGVALPSSPLHYLIFHAARGRPAGLDWLDEPEGPVLVMTSANSGGEPILVDDAEASRALAGVADVIAGHDRVIVGRSDDPVVRCVGGAPLVVRRGRGQVPGAIALGRAGPTIVATGAFLKSSVCVTRGDRAYLSQHLGDLESAATRRVFDRAIAELIASLDVVPAAVAHDLHPDFPSTRWAEASGLPCFAVQHHHAHVAAVLAEHGREGPSIGLALDGAGLGDDGASWGGELLRVEGARFRRLGHLAPLPAQGGDAAAREPWRMAVGALHRLGRRGEITKRFGERGERLALWLDRASSVPTTTACGRLFDAACALLGVRDRSGYEGEAPMVLESLVRRPRVLAGGFAIRDGVLDLLPLLDALVGEEPVAGAELFHGTLAAALVEWTMRALEAERATSVVLSGGCIVNAVLTSSLVDGFARRGVESLLPRVAPPGDGGISLGQAWVAARAVAE